jgi:hypothetical protein
MVVYLRPGFSARDEGLKPNAENEALSARAITNAKRKNRYFIDPLAKKEFQ